MYGIRGGIPSYQLEQKAYFCSVKFEKKKINFKRKKMNQYEEYEFIKGLFLQVPLAPPKKQLLSKSGTCS